MAERKKGERILTINGGSSSIKFAVFASGPRQLLNGAIEKIGDPSAVLEIAGESRSVNASDHREGASVIAGELRQRPEGRNIAAIGHRIVHGGIHLTEHQILTDKVLQELKESRQLDLAHLPREIALVESMGEHYPGVPQVACLDTAFHRNMPRLSHLLPIPRKLSEAGIRRLGFHGLSYSYLMEELERLNPEGAKGRVILAHLGSGASMSAVRGGKPFDTSMGFTPTGGLVMGTRPGDIDPGLLLYLMRREGASADEMIKRISSEYGLKGISETTSDMQELIERSRTDEPAKEAVGLFCYQAKKFIGAYAAAMGGLETLVFSGGIGEHSHPIRARICEGLQFLGVHLDQARNEAGEDVVSSHSSAVGVRVIATNEELMIAKITTSLLGSSLAEEDKTASSSSRGRLMDLT